MKSGRKNDDKIVRNKRQNEPIKQNGMLLFCSLR